MFFCKFVFKYLSSWRFQFHYHVSNFCMVFTIFVVLSTFMLSNFHNFQICLLNKSNLEIFVNLSINNFCTTNVFLLEILTFRYQDVPIPERELQT